MRIGSRKEVVDRISQDQDWDLIVIGGGITGAGILREAARAGFKVLLLEQMDYAWGTSSRSSKMVHGGLRYLGAGQVGLARKSLTERERLISEAPGLVERCEFTYPIYKGKFPGRFAFAAVMAAYDLMAGKKTSRYLSRRKLNKHQPGLTDQLIKGAFTYSEGTVDDARLVQRVIGEAVADGAVAINYVKVENLLHDDSGKVVGVEYSANDGSTVAGTLNADVVVDATGVWADKLEPAAFDQLAIRPLRGSHLVLPIERLGITTTVAFMHPEDGRPVFAYPWHNRLIFGTTDVDHGKELNRESTISLAEYRYLTDAIEYMCGQRISEDDVLSTYSGVRPVLSEGKTDNPSKEKRDEAVWVGNGIVCAGGGKLTTFRLLAREALKEAEKFVSKPASDSRSGQVFVSLTQDQLQAAAAASIGNNSQLDADRLRVLGGRFGRGVKEFFELAESGSDLIADTPFSLAELRYSARYEQALHLDDLMLRRTRLGNILPDGGSQFFAQIKVICVEELGWSDDDWQSELDSYQQIWRRHYAPAPGAQIIVA